MAPASKKAKLTNSSTVIGKNNSSKLSKTVTRSRSKEIIIEQIILGAKPVKVNRKAGSHSKGVDQHLSGKTVKPCKSPSKSKSLVSDSSSLSKSSRMVHTEKPIRKGNVKDEKLKQLEKTIKNLRARNSSLKQQLEEWKKSIETQSTAVDLTFAAEINLDKLMEAKINPKLIEAELIRRKIPRNSDIWLTFESLVESEEEKIKKQKTKEEFYKYLKEKQLLQEQIANLKMAAESVNKEHQDKVQNLSRDIIILKKDVHDFNINMIDTEFSLSESTEFNEKECRDIVNQISELRASLTEANERHAVATRDYGRLVRYREENPLPPCEICANQKAEYKKEKNLYRESKRKFRQMDSKYEKAREDKWAAAKLKGGLEAEIKLLRQKIHGTKCINANDQSLTRMGTGMIDNAKTKYDEQLAFLEKIHCVEYEGKRKKKTPNTLITKIPYSSNIFSN